MKGVIALQVMPIITCDNKKFYVLLDKNGDTVIPVVKFLKFKENIGSTPNTLRLYCFNLKLYFEFLEQKNNQFNEVTMDLLREFVSWLQNPHQNIKVTSLHKKQETKRNARTANSCLISVLGFYGYLLRQEELSMNINEKFKKEISEINTNFKYFPPSY